MRNRQDVHNVKRAFNTECIQRHADDHTSVHIWVEELNALGTETPVLLYKPQGIEQTEETVSLLPADFVLCLQTVAQRQFMLQFGNAHMVCVDSTHGTNQYHFNLVTVMVIDDHGEGLPVAFMLSNREDELVLREFFSAVKRHLPPNTDFAASHIMTDDAPQYFNAWQAVFGPAEKKLCTWHIDRAWRKAIQQHVVGRDLQLEVYHMLRSLLQELDQDAFHTYLSAFEAYVRNVAPAFADYFTGYSSRVCEWAYSYRVGVQANTNMYVESFHSVLKSAYMERKANRRIDSLLSILLRIARDKVFERMIKLEKNAQSKKQRDITKRHSIVVEALPAQTHDGWLIPSTSHAGHSYYVISAKDTCQCSLHCRLCDCCPHMYDCSCLDYAVHATVCKHIHTVHQLRQQQDGSAVDSCCDTAPVDDSCDNNLTSLVPHAIQADNDDVSVLRVRLQTQCDQLVGAASLCDDRKALLCALGHVKSATAAMQALARVRPKHLVVTTKVASNKKLDKQLRFFSTRLKRRAVHKRLRKPATAQIMQVKQKLLRSDTSMLEDNEVPLLDDVDMPLDMFQSMSDGMIPYCIDTETVHTEQLAPEPSLRSSRHTDTVADARQSTSTVADTQTGPAVAKRLRFDSSMPYNEGTSLTGKGNYMIQAFYLHRHIGLFLCIIVYRWGWSKQTT